MNNEQISASKARERRGQCDHYLLRLFMAGNGPNSQKALVHFKAFAKSI